MVDLERRKVSFFFFLIEIRPDCTAGDRREKHGGVMHKPGAAADSSPVFSDGARHGPLAAHPVHHDRGVLGVETNRGVALKPCRRQRCLQSGPGSPGRVTRSLRGPRVPSFSIGTRPTEPAP